MKKIFCFNFIIVCMILGFALSTSAIVLPPSDRVVTGRITKIFKDKTKTNFVVKVQMKKESIILQVPHDDPSKLMARIKEYRGKLVIITYSFPDMTIINIKVQEKKKTKNY